MGKADIFKKNYLSTLSGADSGMRIQQRQGAAGVKSQRTIFIHYPNGHNFYPNVPLLGFDKAKIWL